MPDRPLVTLIIPAFNEAGRLPDTLSQLAAFCGAAPQKFEVVIVVEKSTDTTLAIASAVAAEQRNFRVVACPVQRGKGFAVRTGMRVARGEVVFFMDADLSTPLAEVHKFLQYFEAHPACDILIGNRQHPLSRIERRQSWLRENMGRLFNLVLRAITGLPWRDTQCGFKAFRRKAAQKIFAHQRIDGFAFDAEVLLLAARFGFRIVDLPVRWINSPHSKVRLVLDSLRMLWDALRIRRVIGHSGCQCRNVRNGNLVRNVACSRNGESPEA